MTAIPDEMRQNLLQISKALKDIDTSVQQVAGADLDIEKDLNKLGQAHHHLSLCYSLCGLFWIKLQLNGQDTKEHPVAKEMARLKIHMDRLQEIERSLEKRNLVIDKEASQRIIAHHSDLDKKSKSQLISGTKRNWTSTSDEPQTSASGIGLASRAASTATPSSVGISMNPFKKKTKVASQSSLK